MYINWYEIHRRWILYKSIKPLLHNLRNLRVKSYALPRNLKSLVITVIHDNLFSVFLDPTSDLLHNPFCFLHTPFLFSSYAFSVSSQSFSAFLNPPSDSSSAFLNPSSILLQSSAFFNPPSDPSSDPYSHPSYAFFTLILLYFLQNTF